MSIFDKYILNVMWYIPGSVRHTIRIFNSFWDYPPIVVKESSNE